MRTDLTLGLQVQEHLRSLGIETPMRDDIIADTPALKPEVREAIEHNFANIMRLLGLDLTDDSLEDTPKRVAKMYLDEIFKGLDYSNFPSCMEVDNKMNYTGMVVQKDITVHSVCEHHFVTIYGKAKVAYIPKDAVIGLSKLNRIVDFFSRRPQVQERLVTQIWHTLSFLLNTEDVAVTITAEHYCVKSRGVQDDNSVMVTPMLGGAFLTDSAVRAEYMAL